MSQEKCQHHQLAQGVVAQVEYCVQCRVFHVSIDSLTVRFRPVAMRDLRDTLTAALARYQEMLKEAGKIESSTRLPGQEVH
jgi:hypothetical protein